MQITITDTITGQAATVDHHDAAETIRGWYEGAPQEVLDTVDVLQGQLNRGEYTGDSEAYLALRIEH